MLFTFFVFTPAWAIVFNKIEGWAAWNAYIYVFTVITTIGYGNFASKTGGHVRDDLHGFDGHSIDVLRARLDRHGVALLAPHPQKNQKKPGLQGQALEDAGDLLFGVPVHGALRALRHRLLRHGGRGRSRRGATTRS